jgi:ArsR family transcriptional regulator
MNDDISTGQLQGPCSPLDLVDFAPDECDEELAALAKAIAHPVRLQIIRLLSSRSACVCGEIVDQLPLAQSTVSEHLRILKSAGLIKGEIDGPRVCYCLEAEGVARLKTLIESLS